MFLLYRDDACFILFPSSFQSILCIYLSPNQYSLFYYRPSGFHFCTLERGACSAGRIKLKRKIFKCIVLSSLMTSKARRIFEMHDLAGGGCCSWKRCYIAELLPSGWPWKAESLKGPDLQTSPDVKPSSILNLGVWHIL